MEDAAKRTQRVVCFTETPLEHTYALFADIEDRERKVKLQPYGLALPKLIARRAGVNPVWYIDMTLGHDWLANDVRKLRDEAVATGDFHNQPIARLLPFFDWMGGPFPNNPTSKEFWWEREWRHRGDLSLVLFWSKIIWLCPEAEHARFRATVEEATPEGEQSSGIFLDPSWGSKKIIAHLAGLPATDVSVFAASEAHDAQPEPPPEF